MLKVVLVDDEILVLNLLQKLISKRKDLHIVGTFTDSEQAAKEIPALQPDIAFLDVDMPELNGIELGTHLIESNENANLSIVFVTAYEQYAIHAFKLNAVHYILKPVDPVSLHEAVERVYQKKSDSLPVKYQKGKISLFGHIRLQVDERKIDFLTGKIEELLALLILNRKKGISKWNLIDVLWPEASVDKSQQNLYTMIFRLKKTLQSAGVQVMVHCKNSIYTLDFDDVYCDLLVFDEFIEQDLQINETTVMQFERIIALYEGDLFAEKDYMWAINERERYYQLFFKTAQTVAAFYEKQQQWDRLKEMVYQIKPLLIEEDYEQLEAGLRL